MYSHIDHVINFALQYGIYHPAYPLEIGAIILRIYPNPNLLTTAILYSTIDHSSSKSISKGLKQIKDHFGTHIAHKISNIINFSNYEHIACDLTQVRKFTDTLNFVDKTTNFSILLIRLATLLHSISVFNKYYSLSHEQIKLISLEILEVYLPLISGADIKDVKTELQEFCTKVLYPDINKDIKKYLGAIELSEEFLNDIAADLNKELSSSQIKVAVSGRIKSYYSIWRKLHYKNTTIEKLNDIIGFRIIVDNIDDCYSALKVIHQRYQFLPDKFHDFINIPKGNGYQSLHTVIVGPKSQKIEVQVRTAEMHQVAQYGSAAHWQYKHDFTKTLSVFISVQKLYTKPTVNLSTPNTVTQLNNNHVNTNIIATSIQHHTPAIHMSFIGLLAIYNKEQSTDDKVATDENQYITSRQIEYADNCIAVQPLVFRFINLSFKFMEDNVYDQIINFIVRSDVANLFNIYVKSEEFKVQEFWDDISYVSNNYNIKNNKQNKNSTYVSFPSKKEVSVICINSYVYSNCPQILTKRNSVATENIDVAKTVTLTNIESNSNELNSEQITREEKQEINPTQDLFSTTLWVSNINISDNTTDITNPYEPKDNDVQYLQLDLFNIITASKVKEGNTYSEYSNVDEDDNEGNVVFNSENKTTNIENKTSSIDPLFLSNDPVNVNDNHEYVETAHAENEDKNSTNITKGRIIKLHRYAAKIFCAIIKSKEFKKQLQSIAKNDLKLSIKKLATLDERDFPIRMQIHLFNAYESICPENIYSIFNSVDITPLGATEKNVRIVNNLIKRSIYQGPQIKIGTAIIEYFNRMLTNKAEGETDHAKEVFECLCTLYEERYSENSTNGQNVLNSDLAQEIATSDKIDWDVINEIKRLQVNWKDESDIGSNHANKDSKLMNSTNKISGNEGNTDQYTKIIEFVRSGNLIEVYNILFNYLGDITHPYPTPQCALKNILNIKDEKGNTPILIAIRKGDFPMVMLLLSFGNNNLNAENESHDTPLSLAFTSCTINRCIINLLMQKMIIKYEEQLSIKNENFKEFVTNNEELKQFYNACRSYVEKFSSVMIIDLLVEMNVVSLSLMKNLVVGLYYNSYIEGDDEFREYLKCIGYVDTDAAKADCNMMMFNEYKQAIESQSTTNSIVPERYSVISIEDIKKLLKCAYALQRSNKQLLIIYKTMTQHSQHFKIDDKKLIDIEWMLEQLKCQSDVDYNAELTTVSTICKYVIKTATMMRIEYNSMSCRTDEMQESHSNQDLMKYYTLIDEHLLEEMKKIVEVMTRPVQQCEYNGDDDKSITKDAIALHTLCAEALKVNLLARNLMAFFVKNDKNISTEYFTKKYEEMLESTHKVEELSYTVCSFTTLSEKDLSLFDRKSLPALSDAKILPEYSIIAFLRKDTMSKTEDRQSIIAEVQKTIENDVGDTQLVNDILLHVAHEIELRNTDDITLTGEQHDFE